MKIINEELLKEFRLAARCEFCGYELRRMAEAAHVFSRGAGRLDIRINLVSLGGPWCCACHHSSHSGNPPTTEQLVALVAKREGFTAESLVDAIYLLRRSPKEADAEELLRLTLQAE